MEVITDLLPVKRDNLGRPVIPISIGMVDFLEALCDFGSSVNIILGRPFLNTSGAVIYASAAKINFYIKGRKETFSFKNKTT